MEMAPTVSESIGLIHDEKLWLSDGNIIVRAGSGTGGSLQGGPLHGFKCHRSILTLSSPVFATMFNLPSQGNYRVDDVECVDLPDPWEDVRDLLWCLYGFLYAAVAYNQRVHSDMYLVTFKSRRETPTLRRM